ncbi:Protein CREG1 [Pseudolycoriella hygida]|uniref:Protein CREG1 n=1 Tax=Pseudolycoriella hygida TaxID=35572 RepID=A0A9Q0S9Y5_9DIPT|nr:Protein CREG1 [Pseudolycoriella hygida]
MAKLLFFGMLIAVSSCLSIRDFSLNASNESNDIENVPNHTDYAAVARYVVHKSEWASMGTLSTLKTINGFPMVNIISVADSGKDEPSTGHIYFYLTNLDYTGQDLMKNNKLTAMFSNDQDLECSKNGVDPMEPTCARIMISGSAVELDKSSDEFQFANKSFLSRHPAAATWVETHNFYLCKLDISQIIVLDWYGGPHYVSTEDYYNANETLNGFLYDKFLSNPRQSLDQRGSVNNMHNENKIKIKIEKGNDKVTIEF